MIPVQKVFRTLSNICDEVVLRKQLADYIREKLCHRYYQGPKYPSGLLKKYGRKIPFSYTEILHSVLNKNSKS